MKLKGINISSIEVFREHFDLEEAWGNIGNGMLLACQEEFARQNVEAAKELAGILKSYGREGELEERLFVCYGDGGWKQDGLREMLEPLSRKSIDHKGDIFYSRNAKGIQNILRTGVWNVESAALFCVFLLLMLQVKPMEVVSAEDFRFIQEQLHSAADRMKHTVKAEQGYRMWPGGSKVWSLKNGQIFNPQNKRFSPSEEKISCFAFTQDLGVLAFTEQGEVSSCTHPNRKCELEEKLKGRNGKEKRVSMVAAYGKIYLILMEDGEVLTNVQDALTGWKDIRWVGAGQNSITAVKGSNRNLLQIGADDDLNNMSGVKAAYTRSTGGNFRYAVIKEDGSLIMDDGVQEQGVSVANICREGYIYAVGSEIFIRDFDVKERKKCRLEGEGTVLETCRAASHIYCRIGFAGAEKIVTLNEGMFEREF